MGLTRNRRALLFTGAIGLASLLTLFEVSTPGLSVWALALVPYWLALAIAWSWMLGRGPGRRGWAPWMSVPLALVLGTVLLVKTDAPLREGMSTSRTPGTSGLTAPEPHVMHDLPVPHRCVPRAERCQYPKAPNSWETISHVAGSDHQRDRLGAGHAHS